MFNNVQNAKGIPGTEWELILIFWNWLSEFFFVGTVLKVGQKCSSFDVRKKSEKF